MPTRKQQQLYLRIEFEVKTELVVEGLNEQGGAVEVFPRLQTQTQTNRDRRPSLQNMTNFI